ncbi:GntR family transcriptional regulator [Actinokineospora sp. HUAS TT18]|uniref:GntR family transcriptional regulator n=1 Tax=Actinokineospora sp. HUAS TT18 TaxID=3447451 RepID=UPI003F523844
MSSSAAVPFAGARRLRSDRARLVADAVRRQILRGDYQVLPDERLLCEEFGVSRNTVREGLDLLRCEASWSGGRGWARW